jgi:hypothetical protein
MAHGDHSKIVTQFFNEVFARGNFDFIDRIIASDYSFNGSPSSAERTKTWAKRKKKRYGKLHFSITNLMEKEGSVSFEWTMTGINLENGGESVRKVGRNTLTFRNGRCIANHQINLELDEEVAAMTR